MPVRMMITVLATVGAGLSACAEPAPTAPPTGIDTTIAVDAVPGWNELESAIGEPTDSRRLESYLEFWRESLHRTRQDLDPVARQHGEHMWWAEADRALTSMLGPDNGARVLRWMEEAFTRRTGGAS